jgi:MFS family permease
MMGTAAAALVLLSLAISPGALVATGFVLGFTAQAVKVCVDSIVQANVDDQHRGLVFALYDVLFNAAFVAAAALAAWVVPPDGYSVPLLLATAAALALAGLRYRRVTVRAARG